MNEKTRTVEEIQQAQGWNDDTLMTFALRFISGRGLDTAFEDYLREMADDENAECSDDPFDTTTED